MSLANRQQILDTLRSVVCGNRIQDYGEPEDSFGLIAKLWNPYLEQRFQERPIELLPQDIAILQVLLKVARIAFNPFHKDSFLDITGYGVCGLDSILDQEQKK